MSEISRYRGRAVGSLGLAALVAACAAGIGAGAAASPGPTVRSASGAGTLDGQELVPGEVLVRFKPGTDGGERAEAREAVDAKLADRLLLKRTELIQLSDGSVGSAVRALERQPDVLYAEPNFVYRADAPPPDDTRFGELWGLDNSGQTVNGAAGTAGKDIDALSGWDTSRGNGTVIAIVDSGVADDHPDLAPNVWQNGGETPGNSTDDDGNGKVDDIGGWDFVDDDNDPDDFNGHGSHVAGTAAAEDDNALGVAGAAPDADVMSVRVLNAAGNGANADIADGIVYAAQNGADVVNLSLGGPEYSTTISNALHVARTNQAAAVAAAGNDGTDNDLVPDYPCAYQHTNLVCVAAIDQNGTLRASSNYGDVAVDVGAPGENVLSSVPLPLEAVYSDDFETALAGRWESGGTNNSWARASAHSVSPAHSLEDSPGGMTYVANTDSFIRMTTANAVDLSGQFDCRAEFEVDHKFTSGDKLWVETIDSVGATTTAASLSGAVLDFVSASVAIPAVDGDPGARLQFRLQSDGDAFVNDGVYIDDVAIVCRNGVYDNSSYEFLNGTSMAAPHVSGIAALVRAAAPTSTAAQIAKAIRDGAVAEPSLAGRTVTGGRADADGAIAAIDLGAPDDTPPDPGPGLADSPWPMFQHDAQHTGRSPHQGPGKLVLDWSFPVEGSPGSPAIGEDGTVYLPAGKPNTDLRGYLYAIKPDGTLRWRYEFPQPADVTGQVPIPGVTTPAIAADGTIYVHTTAGKSEAGGGNVIAGLNYLFAINPDGTTKWVYEIGAAFTGPQISSPAIAPDGTIYFGSLDTGFYSIDSDGDANWAVSPNDSSIKSAPAIAPDGTVYVQNTDLYAYNPDGTPKWSTSIDGLGVQPLSPSVGADGTAYACVRDAPGSCNAIAAADGSISWSFPTTASSGPETGAPALSLDGGIHFTDDANHLYALNPSGTQRWLFTGPDGNRPTGSPLIGSDGRIYTMRSSGGLFAINSNGTEGDRVFNIGTGTGIALGSNGTLYYASDLAGGTLYAYVNDSTPPDPPTISATTPVSPANDNEPEVKGSAEAGSTVRLYSGANCSGGVLDTGTAVEFASPGLTPSPPIPNDATTTFRATATDAVGNVSACSSSIGYVEDSTAPTDPTVASTSHTAGVASSDTTVDVSFSGAADGLSGVDGFSYLWNTSSGTVPDTVKEAEQGATGTTSPSLADGGSHWFHLRTRDNAGNWTSTVHLGPFAVDTTAPTDPSLASPSHTPGVASNDPTVDVSFSGAADGLSGVDGFSYLWNTSSGTVPDTVKEAEQGAAGTTSPSLTDGGSHWFHLRTRDNAGNWTSTAHLGPFVIDTIAPTDPSLASPSHTLGVASTDRTVDVAFTGAADALSGVDGFSYQWDASPGTVPDTTKEAEQTATGTTSPTLADGSHWFHLRTRDNAGNWTSTAHLGPFAITSPPVVQPPATQPGVQPTPTQPGTVPAQPAKKRCKKGFKRKKGKCVRVKRKRLAAITIW